MDLQKDFVQMLFVTKLESFPLELGGVRRTEFVAPVLDGFVREENAAKGNYQLHIAQTQDKVEVQPNARRNNILRKPITAIRSGWHFLGISSARLDSTL